MEELHFSNCHSCEAQSIQLILKTLHDTKWGIVKIMVPFWVPIIIRGLIEGTQKGTIVLTIPQVTSTSGSTVW